MPKITPSFLFDVESLDAAAFYVSVFPNSSVKNVRHYNEVGPMPAGTVLVVEFQLDGQDFTAVNSGMSIDYNEALSLRVDCESQDEVDMYWTRLSERGEEGMCGWLKDRFGVSWQIVPTDAAKYLGDPDPARAERAMKAMLGMRKLDLAVFQAAVNAE
jgi:predicted 3-demethylubiquinone-9 3-methyltransferase (glyoxalase superfamily)